jgi:hypothetical protein
LPPSRSISSVMIWHFVAGAILFEKERRHLTLEVPTAEVLMSVRHYTLEKNSTNIFTFDSSCDNLEGSLVA